MARLLYDFLNTSLLFDEGYLADDFAGISQAEWERTLKQYLLHAISQVSAIAEEVLAGNESSPTSLMYSQFASRPLIPELKQDLVYFDRVLVPAPTFFPNNRTMAAADARYMKAVTPFVAERMLWFIPPFGDWPGEDKVRGAIDAGRVSLEARLVELVDSRLIQEVPRASEHLRKEASKKLVDLILSDYCNDSPRAQLSQSVIVPGLRTVHGFLSEVMDSTARDEDTLAQLSLQLRLPGVEAASVTALARVRQDCGDAFRTFQNALRRGLRQIRNIKDPILLEQALRDLGRNLMEQEVQAVENALRRAQREMKSDLLLALGSGAVAAHCGLFTPTGTILGAACAQQTLEVIRTWMGTRELPELPGYFLWKLAKQAKS